VRQSSLVDIELKPASHNPLLGVGHLQELQQQAMVRGRV
jgi:hypothetical protein